MPKCSWNLANRFLDYARSLLPMMNIYISMSFTYKILVKLVNG